MRGGAGAGSAGAGGARSCRGAGHGPRGTGRRRRHGRVRGDRRAATGDAPGRLLAERDEPLLAALSPHLDLLALQIDVTEIETDRFGRAQAAGVDELDERRVPERERRIAVGRCDRLLDLGDSRGLRQTAPPPGRQGRLRHPRRPERVADEGPHRRQPPRDRRGSQPASRPAELGGVRREGADVEVVERRGPRYEATPRSRGGRRRTRVASRPTAGGSRGSGRSRRRCPRLPCSRPLRRRLPMRITPRPRDRSRDRHRRARRGPRRPVRRSSSAPRRLVGDSLNVGTEPYLRDALDGLAHRRPRPCRPHHRRGARGAPEPRRSARTRRRRRASARTTPTARRTSSERSSRTRVALAGRGRCVVWATIVRDGEARAGFNEVLEKASSAHPALRLVDWASLVEQDGSLLADDLVHATPDGYARRAEETARVVEACGG